MWTCPKCGVILNDRARAITVGKRRKRLINILQHNRNQNRYLNNEYFNALESH